MNPTLIGFLGGLTAAVFFGLYPVPRKYVKLGINDFMISMSLGVLASGLLAGFFTGFPYLHITPFLFVVALIAGTCWCLGTFLYIYAVDYSFFRYFCRLYCSRDQLSESEIYHFKRPVSGHYGNCFSGAQYVNSVCSCELLIERCRRTRVFKQYHILEIICSRPCFRFFYYQGPDQPLSIGRIGSI